LLLPPLLLPPLLPEVWEEPVVSAEPLVDPEPLLPDPLLAEPEPLLPDPLEDPVLLPIDPLPALPVD